MSLKEALLETFNTNFVAYLHSHIAHVNVMGRNFMSDHKLLGKIYEDLQGEIDKIAELLRTLDEFMPHDLRSILSGSSISDYPVVGESEDLLQGVYTDLTDLCNSYKATQAAADDEGHSEISNYAQDRILAIGKFQWMIRSTIGNYVEEPEEFDVFNALEIE
jgi:starvation-inducible DNA-binding protein